MAFLALRTVLGAGTTMLDSTFANSTNTESRTALFNDRINLISATTLVGVTYGAMTTLYCMTAYALVKKLFRRNPRTGSHSLWRSKLEWRKTIFYIAYTSVLFVLATIYTAGNSQDSIVAYVNNRLYPGGPYEYYVTFMAGQPVMVMTDFASLMILWLTDALILCRFIMFYYKVPYARWIIPLPCAMYVGVIVLSALLLQDEAGLGRIFYLSENILIAYYALSFSLNVLSTVLIAARLYWHKIQLERVFGSNTESPYMNVATLLIESAALYGIWSLGFLILCILQSPAQVVILATVSQIQVIAPLLIILWTARGKAWNSGKSYAEGADETSDRPSSRNVGRFSFGSQPTRTAGKYSMDVRPDTAIRNASWSTVGGDKINDQDIRADVHMVELGLRGSKPPSITNDP